MYNKVSWIEDDADVIYPVIEPLLKANMEIQIYRTYSDAMKNVHVISKGDLVLLDLILPLGKSLENSRDSEFLGLKLLRHLRKEVNTKIPIIVFSVIADDPDLYKELTSLGAIMLSKPIRPSELRNEVFSALGISPI